MQSAGLTDIGRVRTENEDAFLVDAPLLAVADGMGGHAAGARAARAAIDAVHANINPEKGRPAAAIKRAFTRANRTIREIAAAEGYERMGTTLTVATVHDGVVWVGHVGDSRAYLLRDDQLTQLTADHSLVGELVRRGQLAPDKARTHPKRNVITKAVGSDKLVKPDIFSHKIRLDDRLILCTDGLTGAVDDRQLAELASIKRAPEAAVSKLVAAANQAGGADNTTIVIGDIETVEPRSRSNAALFAVVGALLAALAVGGADYWLDNTYYLTISQGRVAVNRGLPAKPFGLKLGRFDRRTSIDIKDLPDYYVARLEQEIVVGNAERLKDVIADIEGLADSER